MVIVGFVPSNVCATGEYVVDPADIYELGRGCCGRRWCTGAYKEAIFLRPYLAAHWVIPCISLTRMNVYVILHGDAAISPVRATAQGPVATVASMNGNNKVATHNA